MVSGNGGLGARYSEVSEFGIRCGCPSIMILLIIQHKQPTNELVHSRSFITDTIRSLSCNPSIVCL